MTVSRVLAAGWVRGLVHLTELDVEVAADKLACVRLENVPAANARDMADVIRSGVEATAGLDWPRCRITMKLNPLHSMPSYGAHQLSTVTAALALAVMVEAGQVKLKRAQRPLVLGGLALDGRLQPSAGVFAAAMHALGRFDPDPTEHLHSTYNTPERPAQAITPEPDVIVVPAGQIRELALLRGVTVAGRRIEIVGVETLGDLVRWIGGGKESSYTLQKPPPAEPLWADVTAADERWGGDLSELRGPPQMHAAVVQTVEALKVGQGILLHGVGASPLAQRLASILPPPTREATLQRLASRSLLGLQVLDGGRIGVRHYRAPHHTISIVGLLGNRYLPGEVFLARDGVLLLDDVGEFRRDHLESIAWVLQRSAPTARPIFPVLVSDQRALTPNLEECMRIFGITRSQYTGEGWKSDDPQLRASASIRRGLPPLPRWRSPDNLGLPASP